ncbi:hypothetical protein BLD50_00695 [Bacillus cereus]|nr:hypothetical protein BLD50_00695 [Bacillus cereus]
MILQGKSVSKLKQIEKYILFTSLNTMYDKNIRSSMIPLIFLIDPIFFKIHHFLKKTRNIMGMDNPSPETITWIMIRLAMKAGTFFCL